MPRRAKLQNSWTKGVLDPRLRDRIDLQHYYNSARAGDNIEVRPQGGFVRRGGTAHKIDRIRRRIEPLWLDADMVTTHNGGTPANLFDNNAASLFTTDDVAAPEFVVVEIDLGADLAVDFVDIASFKCATAGGDDVLAVEYYDGDQWTNFAASDDAALSPRRNVRTAERTRRFASAPGGGVTARHWRVVLYGMAGAGAFSCVSLRMWSEAAWNTNFELYEFSKSSSETYQLVMTARNIDVFDAGSFLASLPIQTADREVDLTNVTQALDTALLFHEDVETLQVTRQGADDEWNVAAASFSNVPDLEAGIAFSGDQDEIQEITFFEFNAGDTVFLHLGALICQPFVLTDSGDLPGQIAAALEGLPSISSSDIAATLESASPIVVRVRFSGASAASRWPVIDAQVTGRQSQPSTAIVQYGIDADGPLMGAATGWPRTGFFVQQRLIVGGYRAAPGTFNASRAGYGAGAFDMQTEPGSGDPLTADFGIQYTIDSDEIETILRIFQGRHLQIFTQSGEWWIENRTLSATDPMNVILATRHGIDAATPLVFADNATLFLQARHEDDADGDDAGQLLRDMVYADVEQNYGAEPLSLLGPHMLGEVVDLAHRRARSVNRGHRISLINADGSMAVLTLLRSQEVIAITGPMTTVGDWRRIMVDTNGRTWMLVERFGTVRMEQRDDDLLLDACVAFSGSDVTQISGLPYADGTAVWAVADRELVGPYTVAGGAITLAVAADSGYVGLPFLADTESNPVREQINQAQPFRPPGRIFEIEASIINTGDLWIGVNGDDPVEVPLHVHDGELPYAKKSGEEGATELRDTPLLDRLITGYRRIEDVQGVSEHPRIRMTQMRPAPMEVRSTRYELAFPGG